MPTNVENPRADETIVQQATQRLRNKMVQIFKPKEWEAEEKEKEIQQRILSIREAFNNENETELQKLSYWLYVSELLEITGKFKTICEVFGMEETPENRYQILLLSLKNLLPASLMDETQPLGEDLRYMYQEFRPRLGFILIDLFEAGAAEKNSLLDSDSLYNHLYRTGAITQVIVAEIEERGFHGDETARALFDENDPIIHPELAFTTGFLHDVARCITHSSEHDLWNERLMKELGLKAEIIEAKHHAIKLDGSLPPDNVWQMIGRLADVFGKLVQDPETKRLMLRTTIDSVSSYSFDTQINRYLNQEVNDPTSMWYGKSAADVSRYIQLEKERLNIARDWLASMGLNLEYIFEKINRVIKKRRVKEDNLPTIAAYYAIYEAAL
jgi:hypothetical protein